MHEYIEKNRIIHLLECNNQVFHYADENYEYIVNDTIQRLCQVIANAESDIIMDVDESEVE